MGTRAGGVVKPLRLAAGAVSVVLVAAAVAIPLVTVWAIMQDDTWIGEL